MNVTVPASANCTPQDKTLIILDANCDIIVDQSNEKLKETIEKKNELRK